MARSASRSSVTSSGSEQQSASQSARIFAQTRSARSCRTSATTTVAPASAQQLGARSPEQNAIEDSARAFVQAYDAGNAAAVAALWTDDGEYVNGQLTVKGRPAIEKLYADFFQAHPGSKMEVRIDSVRLVAPMVAIEQGTASVYNSPNGPPTSAAYTAVQAVARSWALVLAAASCGSVWGLLTWASGGIVAAVVAHVVWVVALTFVWPLQGHDPPDPDEEAVVRTTSAAGPAADQQSRPPTRIEDPR